MEKGGLMRALFCNQTTLMHDTSGTIPGMLGSYSNCPAEEGVQYCVLFPSEYKWGNSRILGYCLPIACTLLEIAQHVVNDPRLNDTFHYKKFINSVNPSAQLAQYVSCAPRAPVSVQEQSGNFIAWTIMGVISVVVLLATLYDYFWKITSQSIPFEVMMMGDDGVAVWALQSQKQASTAIKGKNSSMNPAFGGERMHHTRHHQEGIESHALYQPPLDSSFVQPLFASSDTCAVPEDIGARRGKAGKKEGRSLTSHCNMTASNEAASPQSPMRRGSIFKHTNFSANAVAEEGERETTGSVPLLRDSTPSEHTRSRQFFPDIKTEVFWANKHVQQFLAEISEPPDFTLMLNRVVLCLSLINSFRKWRYYPKSDANLNVFNSWRVLTWMWIMLFSIFWHSQQVPTLVNVGSRHNYFWYALLEKEAVTCFAISTFLIIAGFHALHRLHTSEELRLVSPTLRVRDSQRRCGQIVLQYVVWYIRYIVARFVRVIPITFSILVLVPSGIPIKGEGPFWALFSKSPALHANCMRYWWTNFLLVNNILPLEEEKRCFPWSYYVALEFQLVAMAPFIFLLGKYLHHRVFAAFLGLIMVTSAITRYVELTRQKTAGFAWRAGSHYSLPVGTVYQHPHLMLIPFCAGAALYYSYRGVRQRAETLNIFGPDIFFMMNNVCGAALPEDRASYWMLEKLRMQRVRMLVIWSGLLIIFACIVTMWVVHRGDSSGEDISTAMRVCESFIIFPWCFGVCLLAFPLLFGYGGMFRSILVHRLWCGPSRLVLAAYLLGPIVIGFGNSSSYEIITFGFTSMVVHWIGYVVVTLLLAFVFHMLIERPCLHMSSRGEY